MPKVKLKLKEGAKEAWQLSWINCGQRGGDHWHEEIYDNKPEALRKAATLSRKTEIKIVWGYIVPEKHWSTGKIEHYFSEDEGDWYSNWEEYLNANF